MVALMIIAASIALTALGLTLINRNVAAARRQQYFEEVAASQMAGLRHAEARRCLARQQPGKLLVPASVRSHSGFMLR